MPPSWEQARLSCRISPAFPIPRSKSKALVPALVYFFSVFAGVYFYVKRENIPRADVSLIPSTKAIIRDLYLILPMAVVLTFILMRRSPSYSAIMASLSAAIIIIIYNRRSPKTCAVKLGKSMADGAMGIVTNAIALAAAGMIVGVVTLTGLGGRFVSAVCGYLARATRSWLWGLSPFPA
jgi:TRAP-type uncharacterized transport system fused permease subunit